MMSLWVQWVIEIIDKLFFAVTYILKTGFFFRSMLFVQDELELELLGLWFCCFFLFIIFYLNFFFCQFSTQSY